MQIVVVGAGVSGLAAARRLAERGHEVVVLDKGRSPGGRLATRRIGDATLDHGAQFFTARGAALRQQADDWVERGVARVWNHGFGDHLDGGDGHPRFVGVRGMNSLAKDLARGIDVQCSTMAFAVRRVEGRRRWSVVIDDGTERAGDAVILTCPLPQSFSLLVDAGLDLDERLLRTDYDRTLALLVVLDRPPTLPPTGGVQAPDAVFSFVGDNAAKGLSALPAVTFHAAPEWSEAHWDDDLDAVIERLTELGRPWLGDAAVVERHLKRWRFATPRTVWPDAYHDVGHGVVLAGDAFAGPRVEGAFDSGRAAAEHLLSG